MHTYCGKLEKRTSDSILRQRTGYTAKKTYKGGSRDDASPANSWKKKRTPSRGTEKTFLILIRREEELQKLKKEKAGPEDLRKGQTRGGLISRGLRTSSEGKKGGTLTLLLLEITAGLAGEDLETETLWTVNEKGGGDHYSLELLSALRSFHLRRRSPKLRGKARSKPPAERGRRPSKRHKTF